MTRDALDQAGAPSPGDATLPDQPAEHGAPAAATVPPGAAPAESPAGGPGTERLVTLTQENEAAFFAENFPDRLSVPLAMLRQENILWRRLTRVRSAGDVLSHPILAPALAGLAIGSLRHVEEIRRQFTLLQWLGTMLLLYAGFESFLHFRGTTRLRALYDARVLHELRLGAMSPHDLLAGAVLPFAAGMRLGMICLLLPLLLLPGDMATRGVLGAFLVLGAWATITRPSVDVFELPLYLSENRFLASVRVAFGLVASYVFTYATMILFIIAAVLVMRWLGYRQGANHLGLLAFLAAILLHGMVTRRLDRWRIRRFYRRHGALPRFLDAYLERGA